MRQIGHVDDAAQARLLSDFLYVQGVENQVEDDPGHGWVVWIHDEDDLERGERLLREFRAEPGHPRFRAQAGGAAELREQKARELAAHAKKIRTGQHVFRKWYQLGFGPVTAVLMVVSLLASLLLWLGTGSKLEWTYPILDQLFISGFERGMPEILHGQIWRLFTPMFLHFNIWHILFNMLMLRQLGSVIESREGSLHFILLVLALAAGSNAAQYLVTHHPFFGGMSGVVYGLFGYVWLRGKFDLTSGYLVPQAVVLQMLVWFVLCWVDFIPNVANYAHGGGLALGCAWGWLRSQKNR